MKRVFDSLLTVGSGAGSIGQPDGVRSGSLRLLPGLVVAQLLHEAGASGVLRLSRGRRSKVIHFEKGSIVHIESPRQRERLGAYLVRLRAIEKAVLREAIEAFKQRSDASLKIGDFLVSRDQVTRDVLDRALMLQRENHLFNLAGWVKGSFEFEPDALVSYGFRTASLDRVLEMMEVLFQEGVEEMRVESASHALEAFREGDSPLRDLPNQGLVHDVPLWKMMVGIRVSRRSGYLSVSRGLRTINIVFRSGAAEIVQVANAQKTTVISRKQRKLFTRFLQVILSIFAYHSGEYSFSEKQVGHDQASEEAFLSEAENALKENSSPDLQQVVREINVRASSEEEIVASPTLRKKIEELQKDTVKSISPANLLYLSGSIPQAVQSNVAELRAHLDNAIRGSGSGKARSSKKPHARIRVSPAKDHDATSAIGYDPSKGRPSTHPASLFGRLSKWIKD